MTTTLPKVCIFGPGIVGYATGKAFAAKGIEVGFVGRNPKKIQQLRSEGFRAYTFDELTPENFDFDISFLTISTPTIDGKIDLTGIDSVSIFIGKLLKNLNKYHVVVDKSTVSPGTTEGLILENLEKNSGKKAGQDFGLAMAPEYLREETAFEDAIKPWLIVIGQYDKRSGDLVEKSFKAFKTEIYRCKIIEAEMQKYVHNLFNAVKITFFNEMRSIAKQMGADASHIFEMTTLSCEGMWHAAYGTRDFGPYSGSCLPKDTQAFYIWAKKHGFKVDLLKQTIDVNNYLISQNGHKIEKVIGSQM